MRAKAVQACSAGGRRRGEGAVQGAVRGTERLEKLAARAVRGVQRREERRGESEPRSQVALAVQAGRSPARSLLASPVQLLSLSNLSKTGARAGRSKSLTLTRALEREEGDDVHALHALAAQRGSLVSSGWVGTAVEKDGGGEGGTTSGRGEGEGEGGGVGSRRSEREEGRGRDGRGAEDGVAGHVGRLELEDCGRGVREVSVLVRDGERRSEGSRGRLPLALLRRR